MGTCSMLICKTIYSVVFCTHFCMNAGLQQKNVSKDKQSVNVHSPLETV